MQAPERIFDNYAKASGQIFDFEKSSMFLEARFLRGREQQ